jgi:hypothetical protein
MGSQKKSFWRSVFSEEHGGGSLTRIATAFMVVTVLGLLTYVVVKTLEFPDAAVIVALSAFVISLYGVNKPMEKASDILGALKGMFTKQ